ncbi:hypothetical protein Sste5346_006100 [Sporothrix stenoceras]|uniref:FAD/NAD(P)-binding domain-containing protein n=1 Tax=Sporothrix stenoceras TaxID=5173 RepID=A0ABR3Z377_9PEZI
MSSLLPPVPPGTGPTTANVLIIGAGPAGIAAALTLARQQHSAILFGDGVYRNGRAEQMHLIPGLDGARPSNFSQAARSNVLQNYGEHISFRDVTVFSVQRVAGGFAAVDAAGVAYFGHKLILASGVEDLPLPIDGYAACFGSVIFHCLLCKGYEQRGGASAGVLAIDSFGRAPVALHMARQASSLARTVTIYTNGAGALAAEIEAGFCRAGGSAGIMRVDNRVIRRFVFLGEQEQAQGGGIRLEFVDNSLPADEAFLAHAPKTRPRGPFVSQLGLETLPPGDNDGDIKVELPYYQTSVSGVFAAGDNCSKMKSVAHAMLSGNVAGMGAASQIVAEQLGQVYTAELM